MKEPRSTNPRRHFAAAIGSLVLAVMAVARRIAAAVAAGHDVCTESNSRRDGAGFDRSLRRPGNDSPIGVRNQGAPRGASGAVFALHREHPA